MIHLPVYTRNCFFFCFFSLSIKGDFYDMGGKLLVAAIDIGTSYSGWAFAYKSSYKKDPTDIAVRKW